MHLARALSKYATVRVLTAEGQDVDQCGVPVDFAFSALLPRGIRGLRAAVGHRKPDWLVVQYNAFTYGRWGFNPYLARTLGAIKKECPAVHTALMVHETAPPWLNWRLALMNLWQIHQLRSLGRHVDAVFFSIAPWFEQFGSSFSCASKSVLPVGSNIPRCALDKDDARQRLGIPADRFVIGLFGTAHHSRLLPLARRAAEAAVRANDSVLVCYAGPHGDAVKREMSQIPFMDSGRLPEDEVSALFSSMDLYLAPFARGVSTRRGSFIVALQHGIPTVSTRGSHTDADLLSADGTAFCLVDESDEESFANMTVNLMADPARRAEMGAAAQDMHDHMFSWDVIARKMFAELSGSSRQLDRLD